MLLLRKTENSFWFKFLLPLVRQMTIYKKKIWNIFISCLNIFRRFSLFLQKVHSPTGCYSIYYGENRVQLFRSKEIETTIRNIHFHGSGLWTKYTQNSHCRENQIKERIRNILTTISERRKIFFRKWFMPILHFRSKIKV